MPFRLLHPLLLSVVLLSPPVASRGLAQNPAAPPDAPAQTNTPKDPPLNPALPTVFIVGDSTARNGADLGWGDHFAPFFDTTRINVANRARAGRSSRTYLNEGLWAHTLAEMKAGDFLLLQMGHNDGGDLGGAKPRGSLKGVGEETKDVPQTAGPLAGTTETVHTYGWYMRKMIDEAKAKGVHPILLTLTVRNVWTAPDGTPCGAPTQPSCPAGAPGASGQAKGASGQAKIELDMGYTEPLQQIAQQEHIPLLDLGSIEADRLQALGPEKTAAFFPKDHTHSSAAGAALIAQDVVTTIQRSGDALKQYLKP